MPNTLPPLRWIDSHCHLDAPELARDLPEQRQRARDAGVRLCVIPAVRVNTFADARRTARALGDAYALGTHPLYVPQAAPDADQALNAALTQALADGGGDPRLVAVGEIGLDYFVPELAAAPLREKQQALFRQQLKTARRHGLPLIVHSRHAVDAVLKHLRAIGHCGGIAHAFSGSAQQARAFIDLGFKLGFGGALTYERATRLRQLAATLPLHSLVLETDSPDTPPHWLYTPAARRASGHPQGRNTPAELPRIARHIAQLRGITPHALAEAAWANTLEALPRLRPLAAQA